MTWAILLLLATVCGSLLYVPSVAQKTCLTASPISFPTNFQLNTTLYLENADPNCTVENTDNLVGAWLTYYRVVEDSVLVQVDTCGSPIPAGVQVRQYCNSDECLQVIASNCSAGTPGVNVTFLAWGYGSFMIYIYGSNGAVGMLAATLQIVPFTNSEGTCTGAITEQIPASVEANTWYSPELSGATCDTTVRQGLWYRMQSLTGLTTAHTCTEETKILTELAVVENLCSSSASYCVTFSHENCSSVTWNASADETYFVYAAGYELFSSGNIGIDIFSGELASNTECFSATSIIFSTFGTVSKEDDTRRSTTATVDNCHQNFPSQILWYVISSSLANQAMELTLSSLESGFIPVAEVTVQNVTTHTQGLP